MGTSARDDAARKLQEIPNIGPAMARDLLALGIEGLEDLVGRDPERMYADLCRRHGIRYDICVLDVFRAAVDFAEGKPAEPWWSYSRRRKAKERKGK